MKKIRKLKANWHYVFLLLFFVFVLIGLYSFFNKEIQTSHFHSISIQERKGYTKTKALILGEYKTMGEGFFVGKKITISALLYLSEKQDYNDVKNLPAKFVIVENSENPEHAEKDISESIKEGEINKVFPSQGILEMIEFHDDKQTIVLQGDVVFTREGQIAFGLPLSFILEKHNLGIEGISIAPSYIKHQIGSNKIMLLVSFITVSIAFLSLFFGFSKNSSR